MEPPTSKQALRAYQQARLRQLLAILPQNRFYAPLLEQSGLRPSTATLDDFCAHFPFTTKASLIEDQHRNPPFGTNLSFPVHTYVRFHQTSATSGKTPMRWLDRQEDWSWLLNNWRVVYRHAGVHNLDRLLFAFSFGPFLGFWTAFDAAAQLGALCIPAGGQTTSSRLSMILENKITVLLCTPTYAMRLGEAARQEGILLEQASVRLIIVAGEPGGSISAIRRHIEQLWPGARVFDHHGMTEVGPVSYECQNLSNTLRVISGAYLAEIVDPKNGKKVEPGQKGELVLTTLGRFGSPLLRYRTGDLVQQKGTDDQNPDVALAGGILGRSDDLLFVRGVNIYPGNVEEVIRQYPEVAEFRVVVSKHQSMNELKIEIEPHGDAGDGEQLQAAIAKSLRQAFSLRIQVDMVKPGELPRFEMKARRWVFQEEA